jgi:hypothetical protein
MKTALQDKKYFLISSHWDTLKNEYTGELSVLRSFDVSTCLEPTPRVSNT